MLRFKSVTMSWKATSRYVFVSYQSLRRHLLEEAEVRWAECAVGLED